MTHVLSGKLVDFVAYGRCLREVTHVLLFFFFQAEDGIRDRSPSRGLGDVYKRQDYWGI